LSRGTVGDLDRQLVVGRGEGQEVDDGLGQFRAVSVLGAGALPCTPLASVRPPVRCPFCCCPGLLDRLLGRPQPELASVRAVPAPGPPGQPVTPAAFTVRVTNASPDGRNCQSPGMVS
jgi:hypothetical protein